MGDVAARVSELDLIDGLLRKVHGLFAHSVTRQAQWAAFASARGLTELKFPIFNKTRWFSRAQCIRVLVKSLPVLILWLQQASSRSWKEGTSALLRLKDVKRISCLFVLHDLLAPVESLSRQFQSNDLLPSKVRELAWRL